MVSAAFLEFWRKEPEAIVPECFPAENEVIINYNNFL